MKYSEIIEKLPYQPPFLFVDRLLSLDESGVTGEYTFREDSSFYRGHFKDHPITPGVILTECCAQIGVVCLGIYLLSQVGEAPLQKGLAIGMSSSEMEYLLPILPGERVTVVSEKIYYRFHKLKCAVKLFNPKGQLACKGVIAGMLKVNADG